MSGNCQPLTALHPPEIWPGYVTTVHKYKGIVMLCPGVACDIRKINAKFDNDLNVDDVIVLLGNTNNTCRSPTTPSS